MIDFSDFHIENINDEIIRIYPVVGADRYYIYKNGVRVDTIRFSVTPEPVSADYFTKYNGVGNIAPLYTTGGELVNGRYSLYNNPNSTRFKVAMYDFAGVNDGYIKDYYDWWENPTFYGIVVGVGLIPFVQLEKGKFSTVELTPEQFSAIRNNDFFFSASIKNIDATQMQQVKCCMCQEYYDIPITDNSEYYVVASCSHLSGYDKKSNVVKIGEHFDVILFNNRSEDNRVNKSEYLENPDKYKGTFRNSVSIVSPTVVIETNKVIQSNYCYIPNFGRYYYIDDIISVRTNAWELSLRVDPLMSFKDKILELDCKINRQEFNYNPDLVDSEQLVEVEPIIEEIIGTVNGSGFEINSLMDINKPAIENYNIVVSTSSYRLNNIFKEIPHIYSEATAPTSNYFILTPLLLNSFAFSLYNTPPSEDKAFVEPSECLRSVRVYPFNILDYEGKLLFGNQQYVNVGNNALPLHKMIPPPVGIIDSYSTLVVNSVTTVVIRGGSITIPKMYNNFLDYEPYTIIELYIPFIGWVKLPTNLVNGKKLYSKYIVDLETGTAINEIRIDEGKFTQTQGSGANLIPAKDENFLIMTTECDIGYDIPIVRMNTTDQMKRERIANIKSALRWVKTATDIASTVANVASGGITGKLQMAKGLTAGNVGSRLKGYRAEQTASGASGAGGIISSIANTIGENKIDKINAMQYNATSGQAGDSVLANCTVGLKLIARIYHPNPIDIPNYNHLVGRPSDYSGQLKNLQGYTEVGACHMEGFDTATPSEVSEIENQIKTGVIL